MASYRSPTAGALKGQIPRTQRVVSKKLHAYLGKLVPYVRISAPHIPAILNGGSPEEPSELSQPKG